MHEYPHMCRLDHDEVGHATHDEQCPVCLMRDKLQALEDKLPMVIRAIRGPCLAFQCNAGLVHPMPNLDKLNPGEPKVCDLCKGSGKIPIRCGKCVMSPVKGEVWHHSDGIILPCDNCHKGYVIEHVPKWPGDDVWHDGKARNICFLGVDGFVVFKEDNCIRGNGNLSECFVDEFTYHLFREDK